MTYTSWPTAVNTGFYALTESYDDNSSTTEYASGRKAVTLRNEIDFTSNFCAA